MKIEVEWLLQWICALSRRSFVSSPMRAWGCLIYKWRRARHGKRVAAWWAAANSVARAAAHPRLRSAAEARPSAAGVSLSHSSSDCFVCAPAMIADLWWPPIEAKCAGGRHDLHERKQISGRRWAEAGL